MPNATTIPVQEGIEKAIAKLNGEIRKRLIRIASLKARKYKQYHGYFDEWKFGQVTKYINGFKSGVVFAEAQFVIFAPDGLYDLKVYDPTLDHTCVVPKYYIKELTYV